MDGTIRTQHARRAQYSSAVVHVFLEAFEGHGWVIVEKRRGRADQVAALRDELGMYRTDLLRTLRYLECDLRIVECHDSCFPCSVMAW